jgi:hypothetical protein
VTDTDRHEEFVEWFVDAGSRLQNALTNVTSASRSRTSNFPIWVLLYFAVPSRHTAPVLGRQSQSDLLRTLRMCPRRSLSFCPYLLVPVA